MKEKARYLRKNQTDVERIIWYQLRNRRFLNLKFRRQYTIEPYIVDFICVEKNLIIELDGEQHAINQEKDKKRTKILEEQGYKIIRFWNNEVIENIDGVMEALFNELNSS